MYTLRSYTDTPVKAYEINYCNLSNIYRDKHTFGNEIFKMVYPLSDSINPKDLIKHYKDSKDSKDIIVRPNSANRSWLITNKIYEPKYFTDKCLSFKKKKTWKKSKSTKKNTTKKVTRKSKSKKHSTAC